MTNTDSYRILIVDDNRAIHEDYRKILCPDRSDPDLDALEAEIFLEPTESSFVAGGVSIELDGAFQGEEGLAKVVEASARNVPYAAAFVDMRMPPGWDGLETTKRLLAADPFLQIVICTAYSDHSWDELQAVLGPTDRLLILKKPFDSIEVAQLVSSLTTRWKLQRAHASERLRLEGLVRERTKELEMQLEFRETVELALRERQRLESLGSLTAGLSHELNNPLCAISSNLEYLKHELGSAEGTTDPEKHEDLVEVIAEMSSASERIRDVVRDVRTFATQQRGTSAVEVAVESALNSAVRVTAPRLRHLAKVVVESSPAATVMCDEARLEQVLVNLLLNAGDSFGSKKSEDQVVMAGWSAGSEVVEIWVSDNGRGIPEEDLPRVMEPFFTTKPTGQGTGLGLSVCHGIVSSMNGEIEIESELGVGTTVRLRLPAAAGSAREAGIVEHVVTSDDPKRVLIVDDDPSVRRAMKRVFRECSVDVAASAAEGVQACESGTYDVILCDLMMPDALGTEMYESLRETNAEQSERVYLVTGGAVTEAGMAGLSAFPSDRVLSKPLSPYHVWNILHGRL